MKYLILFISDTIFTICFYLISHNSQRRVDRLRERLEQVVKDGHVELVWHTRVTGGEYAWREEEYSTYSSQDKYWRGVISAYRGWKVLTEVAPWILIIGVSISCVLGIGLAEHYSLNFNPAIEFIWPIFKAIGIILGVILIVLFLAAIMSVLLETMISMTKHH